MCQKMIIKRKRKNQKEIILVDIYSNGQKETIIDNDKLINHLENHEMRITSI